ncbi:MAG: hypothetical protein ACLVLI_06160, partial [Aedoeadaptatus pacaensis]
SRRECFVKNFLTFCKNSFPHALRDNFYIIPREIRTVKKFFNFFLKLILSFEATCIVYHRYRDLSTVFSFLLKQIVEADAEHNYGTCDPDRFSVLCRPFILPKNTFQIQQGDDKCNDGENLIGFNGRTLLFSTGLEFRGGFFFSIIKLQQEYGQAMILLPAKYLWDFKPFILAYLLMPFSDRIRA